MHTSYNLPLKIISSQGRQRWQYDGLFFFIDFVVQNSFKYKRPYE